MLLAFRTLVDIGLIAVALAIAAGFAGPLAERLDLLSHARLHLALAAAFCAVGYLVLWARRRAVVAALISGIGLAGTVPWLIAASPAAGSDSAEVAGTFRLMTFNVQGAHRDPAATLAAIRSADPDVLVVPEFWSSGRIGELLRAIFPHSAQCSPSRPCSVAIFSRLALSKSSAVESGRVKHYGMTTQVEIGSRPVTIIGVHADWPFAGRSYWESLAAIADAVRAAEGRLIVAGDFNATPWSLPLRRTMGQTGVASLGGYRATWPSDLGPFGIPIDHVFYRGEVELRDVRAIGGWAGSDHRPLVVTVVVRAAKS